MASSLPIEIWHRIVPYLDHAELKATRLLSKAHDACAQSHLFETLRIYPTIESLRHACKIAASPLLATAVTRLELIDDGVEDDYGDIDDFEMQLHEQRGYVEEGSYGRNLNHSRHPCSPMMKYFHGYLQRVASQRAFSASAGSPEMSSLMQRLPNIQHLHRALPNGKLCSGPSAVAKHKREYGAHVGVHAVFFPLDEVLTYFTGLGRRSLVLDPVNLTDFDMISSLQTHEALYCNLKKLSLHFPQRLHELLPNPQIYVQHLERFLSVMQTVEHLALAMPYVFSDESHTEKALVTEMLLEQTWPKMKRLTMTSFSCTEGQLLSFVGLHASTLEALDIDGLELRRPEAGPQANLYSSVIRSTWKLGQLPNLRLRQCSIQGRVKTDDKEDWVCATSTAREVPSATSLLQQYQEYICRRGPFPHASRKTSLFRRFPLGCFSPERSDQPLPAQEALRQDSSDSWTLAELEHLVDIMNEGLRYDEIQVWLGDLSWCSNHIEG